MNIPPNQCLRDRPWTRFVHLDSSAEPVPTQAKVAHSLTLSLIAISANFDFMLFQPIIC